MGQIEQHHSTVPRARDMMPASELKLPQPSRLFHRWPLRPDKVHLDHGSAGGCPTSVLEAQNAVRFELEAGPPDYYMRSYRPLLKLAKRALADYIHADVAGLCLTPGTTLGLNTIAQSQSFAEGDEIIITNHAYATATKLLAYIAERDRAKVVLVDIPIVLRAASDITDLLVSAITPRTRFALIDHIPSRTGLVYPIKDIITAFAKHDIDVLVDGAHAPGQVPVDLTDMGCAYYVASCHKWMCTPRGVGFMYVRPDKLPVIRPLIVARTAYGRDEKPDSYSKFEHDFDWFGTFDPSGLIVVPKSVEFLRTLHMKGDEARMQANHDLAVEARRLICQALGIPIACPEELVGSMVTIALPDTTEENKPGFSPIQARLWERYGIEIQAYYWPKYPRRLLRFSCQSHNSIEQYQYLVNALVSLLEEERVGSSDK